MADEQRFTMEEWAARLKDVRQRARNPAARLTPDECRDAYLAQLGERVANLEHQVLERQLQDFRRDPA